MVDVFVKTYKALGMEANHMKTKLLIMRYEAPSSSTFPINITGNTIKTVEQFNYLDCPIINNERKILKLTSE